MIETLQTMNHALAIFGIASGVVTLVLLADLLKKKFLARYIQTWGMLIALCTTAGASILTLVYSEVFGIIPCGLCWLERIFLYPQVFLIATALYYKDTVMPRYGIVLSVFGLIISLYHHYIQMGGSEFIKCPASGASDCAKRYIFEFDFVTFPLLSAFLCVFLIVLYIYLLKTNKK